MIFLGQLSSLCSRWNFANETGVFLEYRTTACIERITSKNFSLCSGRIELELHLGVLVLKNIF